MKPNIGSLQIISSEDEFIESSKKLFKDQLILYRSYYPKSDLIEEMENLFSMTNIPWTERYEIYKDYLADNLQKYPKLNPSFYFYEKLPYNIANQEIPKKIEGNINSYTFSSEEETLSALRKIISESKNTIQTNYMKLNPLGFGEKKLFTKFMTLIEDVLS